MPSSYSTSLRFELQFTGENVNLWGDKLNAALSRADDAIAGWATIPLTGSYSLTTANGAADQARMAMLKFTGTGAFTVTVPAVTKRYDVWNACTGVLTLSNGSASVTVQAGEVVTVVTDGAGSFRRVLATDFAGAALTNVGQISGLSAPAASNQAATKGYVDGAISSTAFSMGSFGVPIAGADSGKFLTNNGTTPSWATVVPFSRQILAGGLATGGGDLTADRTITVPAASATDICGAAPNKAITPLVLATSAAFLNLTDAPTIAWEIAGGYNATVTLTASGHQVGAPTLNGGGLYDGCPLCLELVQDGTGGRTVTWNSVWEWGAAGLPTLQTAAAKRDLVFGVYRSATGKIHATFRKGA